ncbi:hypothetical protein PpBr36_03971 [Pyricularia pennisetigena]|uniref:hypothetical protein n=1 Tax=Pyricularia pennisetigena TaxID=1578925 RepID=UPI001150DEEB|nr:hypothetical protein PpBr36_03971 [Pyricularia pennisetigena]TLS26920.1 hypothetical protein PpBr36_03971 [Pyricularia pennisetigena]
MSSNQYNTSPADPAPEFYPLVRLGNLSCIDGTPIGFDFAGVNTKGFRAEEGEWTSYRRNYFSCTASYTLNPQPPGIAIQLSDSSGKMHRVSGFAIGLSAVISGENQPIELVQHTPKRDKGPTSAPQKIRLEPRPAHPPAGNAWMHMVQHTFERLQFKRATPNNGNRPAPQKFYSLEIELWADVGNGQEEEWIKIGYKRSARLVVRGRSPGHYHERMRILNSRSAVAGDHKDYEGPGSDEMISMRSAGFTMGGSGIFSPNYMGYDTRGGTHHSNNRHDFQSPYNSGSY